MSNNKKTAADRAAAAPTALHEAFAAWLVANTGVEVDVKTVQLACVFRMEFQASPENQKDLAARKAKAAADKKASAAKRKARLEAELAKLAAVGKKFNEEKANGATDEEARETATAEYDSVADQELSDSTEAVNATISDTAPSEPAKLTIIYGGNEPEIHKFGCADAKKKTAKMGFSKETLMASSHTELTNHIYDDMISTGESSFEDNYMGYDAKPCCGPLDN